MKSKPIIIVTGEPKSIFFEILFKSLKSNIFKSPLILVSSIKILKSGMKKNNFKKKINLIYSENLENYKLDNKSINLINVNYSPSKPKIYTKNCFDIAFNILESGLTNKFINGPINKSNFLDRKFLGITEYISKKFKIKKNAMLIFNKDLSVCPVTTHLPLKMVTNKISKKLITEKVFLINDFFKKNFNFKPKIAVTGLNPHCESILKYNEDIKIIAPAIKNLKKKGFNIFGPFPADTIFLKQNRVKYNVILGMYHDQVLTPLKTLKEYDAINITLGLPFYRISPDHGPNEKMVNKKTSTPTSLIKAIKFLDQR
tara:strand:+ start:360 stop:1301 length:942 start_codon:yes stop_codon:yes gene_type:complete